MHGQDDTSSTPTIAEGRNVLARAPRAVTHLRWPEQYPCCARKRPLHNPSSRPAASEVSSAAAERDYDTLRDDALRVTRDAWLGHSALT